jgi:hypothetical protein
LYQEKSGKPGLETVARFPGKRRQRDHQRFFFRPKNVTHKNLIFVRQVSNYNASPN